jgi:Tetratricopeptide repeat
VARVLLSTLLIFCVQSLAGASLSSLQGSIHAEQVNEAEPKAQDREALYQQGLIFASRQNWAAAQRQFEAVLAIDPDDFRAYVELAGVAFKTSHHPDAIRHLRKALQIEPEDPYAMNFLATLLSLEGQQAEALYYWNLLGEPRVDKIEFRSGDSAQPELIGRLFRVNEGEVFRRGQLLHMQWEQERLQLNTPFRANLTPGADGNWDLEFALPPRSTTSWTRNLIVTNALRAALHQEVSIASPFELGRGRQVLATWRWHANQKRIASSASIPYLTTGSNRLHLGFDFRDEEWRHTDTGVRYLQKTESFGGEQEFVFEGRKSVSFGVGYTRQRLQFPQHVNSQSRLHFITLSTEWNQRISLNRADTLRLDIRSRYEYFAVPGNGTRQASAAIRMAWDINAKTAMEFQVGGGTSGRSLPLGRYFVLGIGQDDPRPLRAHPTVHYGFKGAAPMGRGYALVNLEVRRLLLSRRWLSLSGLLFSDTGGVSGAPFGPEHRTWYQDIGSGVRFGTLGRDLLDVRAGVDLKTSSFSLWIGVPQ